MKWLQRHSLGVILLALTLGNGLGLLIHGGELRDFFNAFLGDSYGAFIIVIASKWFREEGSAESKEPEEE